MSFILEYTIPDSDSKWIFDLLGEEHYAKFSKQCTYLKFSSPGEYLRFFKNEFFYSNEDPEELESLTFFYRKHQYLNVHQYILPLYRSYINSQYRYYGSDKLFHKVNSEWLKSFVWDETIELIEIEDRIAAFKKLNDTFRESYRNSEIVKKSTFFLEARKRKETKITELKNQEGLKNVKNNFKIKKIELSEKFANSPSIILELCTWLQEQQFVNPAHSFYQLICNDKSLIIDEEKIMCHLEMTEIAFFFALLESFYLIKESRGVLSPMINSKFIFDQDYSKSAFQEALARQRKFLKNSSIEKVLRTLDRDSKSNRPLIYDTISNIMKAKVRSLF